MNPTLSQPQSSRFTLLLLALALGISCVSIPTFADTVGEPWTGNAGVTETVDQIMAREGQAPAIAQRVGVRETHRRPVPAAVPIDDASAAPVSQSPAPQPTASGNVGERLLVPQTVGTSFLGTQLSEAGFIPSDSMGTVGPTQVLVIVNGRIKVFDKNGVLGPLNATTDNFFASVRSATTSDPHARYDRLSQRWFISMIDVATINRVLVAVSSGPTITGAGSFTFFQFQHDLVGTTPNADTGNFADYDTLGVDKLALYLGVDMFNSSNQEYGTTGFVINKAALLSGSLVVTPFRGLHNDGSTSGIGTPQGVDNDDPNATEGYFVGYRIQITAPGSIGVFLTNLTMRRVSNPGGTPTLSSNLNITVPSTYFPQSQVHKGDTLGKNLDTLDTRLFAAHIRKNKIAGTTSLWTAHNIKVTSAGAGSSSGDRNAARWYQISNLTTTPSLTQSGTLFDSAASNPRSYWIPSVASSGQGHMALGCTYASVNDFAGIATAGRLRTDTLGATQAPTLAVISSTAYNLGETPNPHRWGDYSQVAVDPTDDMTMWTFQEYCNAANSWGVQAIQLKAPPPATPANASPSSIAQGQSSVNVVITGTSVSGSEFFDPGADAGGPGFANHIAAAVAGGAVVNSVTFNSPTSITLNLNTTAASAGTMTVTVTNPDGQAVASGSGILTIVAPPTVTSLNRVNSTPSNASTVNWTLTFSSAVTGVTASNFSLSGGGATGASIGTPTTGDGGVNWNVPVTTGADGTLTLSLANSSGQSPTTSTALPFAGQSYTIDKTTLAPSLTAPANNSTFTGIVSVSFSLPETALAGSVKLIFTGSNSRTLTLAATQETSGAHNFTFASASPTGAAQVASISGGTSIPDGTYSVTLSYQDSLGNAAATALSTNVIIDTVTLAPTLTLPATNAVVNNPIAVSFSLPEAALSGSVKLIFSGAASRTLTLAASQEASGPHSFSFNPASPTVAPQVLSISGGTSIPDGVYTVTLSYQDALANPASTAISTNVKIDTATQVPTLIAPATNTNTSSPISISFTLPEAALTGSVKVTFAGGVTRVLNLTSSQETSGNHAFTFDPASPTSSPQIGSVTGGATIPDGTYSVSLSYQDSLGNATATSAVSTNVVIDTITLAPTFTAPATNSISASSVPVSFSLPEAALSGSVKLSFTGPASVILTLAGSQESSGSHSFNFNPANPLAASQVASINGGAGIPDGLYSVTLSYRDLLGNAAASVVHTSVRIDTTPPTFNLPAPIVVTATSPSGAVVNYSASASDTGGSGVASSSFVPPSGSTFPIGMTTVNANATDNAGNSAVGSFTVTVNPNPPPSGGTFSISPNTGVHQGDPLLLTASGWTDPDLPLTYQFFQGASPLNGPGAATTFNLNAPAPGPYTFKVRVTDSAGSFTDAPQSLTVVPFTTIETWRQTNFGNYHNTGSGADTADPDGDSVINLFEFGFGTDPNVTASGPTALVYTGTFAGSGTVTAAGKPIFRAEGSDLRALFIRRADFATANLTYTVEFGPNDLSTWVASGVTPTLLATNGSLEIVSVPFPALVAGKPVGYFRVRVKVTP